MKTRGLLCWMALAACGSPPAIDGGIDAGVDAPIESADGGCPRGTTIVSGDLGASGAAVALDLLCEAYVGALCTSTCAGCGAAPPNCRAFEGSRCDANVASAEVRAAITAGDLVYDEAAAGIAISAIAEAAADCTDQPSRIDLERLLAATGALHGSAADGTDCSGTPFVCAAGSACLGSLETGSECGPLLGAPCDRFGLCASAPGATDLACAGATCEWQSGDCTIPVGALGDACTAETLPCAEGRCAGAVCRPWQCAGAWY